MVAVNWVYFKSKMNHMNMWLVIASVMQHVFYELGNRAQSNWPGAISVAKHLSVLRLARVARLLNTRPLRLLSRIIDTLIFNSPLIGNVLALLLVVYLIFAIIACYLFQDIVSQIGSEFENEVFGFKNFHRAFMYVIRLSTGEDWPKVMYAYGNATGMYAASRIFFVVFTIISNLIFLNLLQLVIVQIFDSFYFNPDNPLTQFQTGKEQFDRTWAIFSVPSKGFSIHHLNLVKFFAHLEEPLGFRVRESIQPRPIEKIVLEEEQFVIRKPVSAIAIILALNKLPVQTQFTNK